MKLPIVELVVTLAALLFATWSITDVLTGCVDRVRDYVRNVLAPEPPPERPTDYVVWAARKHEPTCPSCRKGFLRSGPEGGMCVNFACSECYARYNMSFFNGVLFHFEHIGRVTPDELRRHF